MPPKGSKKATETSAAPASSPPAPAAGSSQLFNEGDKVNAIDGGRLYEAKVVKVMEADGTIQYFLHYMGWNSRWDKWVAQEDLIKDGDEADRMRERLKEQQQSQKKLAEKPSKRKEGAAPKGEDQKAKKSRIDTRKDTEDDTALAQVKLSMPFTLKKQLVTDWESVTQEPRRLVSLPRGVTAAQVMDRFMENKAKRGQVHQVARFQELMDGLKIYFDKALPLILLYRQERGQYERIMQNHPGTSPSSIYGSEHLLRLFVRLPQLLAQTALTPQEVTQVSGKLSEFLRFLQKHHGEFFLQEYEAVQEDLAPEPGTAA